MTAKVYITEYAGLAANPQADQGSAVAEPPLATQVINTAGTTGGIGVLGALTAGTLYTAGTYPNVPLTGGTGSGATANITVAGGGVTAVTIVNPGKGYTAADALSAAAANIGGSGSGFSQVVTSIVNVSAPLNPLTRFVEISADGICNVLFSAQGNGVAAQNPQGNGALATVTTGVRLNANERLPLRGVPPASVNPQNQTTQWYVVSAITNT